MKNLCLITALAVIAFGSGQQSVAAQSGYMKKELYPARVRAITLPNVGIVDANHPTSRGDWKIEFGKSPPKAVYYDKPGRSPQLEIQDLICISEEKGSKSCDITVPTDGGNCRLFVGKELVDTLTIVCPSAIDLVK